MDSISSNGTETVVQDERTVFSIKNLLLRMAMIDSRIDEVREKMVTCPYWIDCSSEPEDTVKVLRVNKELEQNQYYFVHFPKGSNTYAPVFLEMMVVDPDTGVSEPAVRTIAPDFPSVLYPDAVALIRCGFDEENETFIEFLGMTSYGYKNRDDEINQLREKISQLENEIISLRRSS